MEQELESHVIELADTRPTMMWLPYLGEIPIQVGGLLFIAAGLCYSAFGWKYCLWGLAAWKCLSIWTASDYHAMTRFERWLNTSAWSLDSKDQGGSSVTPFPINSQRPRGMM